MSTKVKLHKFAAPFETSAPATLAKYKLRYCIVLVVRLSIRVSVCVFLCAKAEKQNRIKCDLVGICCD